MVLNKAVGLRICMCKALFCREQIPDLEKKCSFEVTHDHLVQLYLVLFIQLVMCIAMIELSVSEKDNYTVTKCIA